MKTPVLSKSRPWAVIVALMIGSFHGPSAFGYGDEAAPPAQPKSHKWDMILHKRKVASQGTLGYGPPGPHPGFQGFGLGYHTGYGYGGEALGVGTEGGYPLFGGPGYPHPAPALRRIGGISPFCYFGGPGGPSPVNPNFFEGVGPLAPDTPVVTIPADSPYAGDYGPFTGSIPYPESTFAPFVAISASGGSSSGASHISPPPSPSSNPPSNRAFGVDGEPVPDDGAGGLLGLKIRGILPGSAAAKAGLRIGDVILTVNGSLTQRSADLFRILENAATSTPLKIKLRTATDNQLKDITVPFP